MRGATQHRSPLRWVLAVLTALTVVWALVLAAGTASAASGPAAEDRIRASASAGQSLDRPPGSVSADQRLGSGLLRPEIVVATGVAANSGCKGGLCNIPGGKCFVAGTLILTGDGLKPIEKFKVGDKVWAKDQSTGEDVLRLVDKTYIRQTTELYELTIDGDVIMTTAEHPFWVDGRGWVGAEDLAIEDVLVTPEGTTMVEKIEVETADKPVSVYNFRVSEDHNYYALAGNTPVLVHNADYPPLTVLHGDDVLGRESLNFWKGQDTDSIVRSLHPDADAPLTVKPDGMIMDGNTRIRALQLRGYDVDSLPRTPYGSAKPMDDDDFWSIPQ